jgi:hypothetical protein
MVTDNSGNPIVDADNLSNPPWAFVGNCPPAGVVAIGSNNDCGDDSMQITLAAGTYTLLLSDANYIPVAINDNGALSEGFTDLTAGVFQTCDPTANACITPNGNYAVDITSPGLVNPAFLLTPTPGSTLTNSAVSFTWSTGGGVSAYQLCVGYYYAGNCNIYASGVTAALSANVTNIPVNGETLFVRLWSRIGTTWQASDYTYTMSGTPVLAAITSPTPGSSLPGSSATFQWSSGSGVTGYILWLGTTKGSYNLYNSGETIANSASVTGLPLPGVTIYARLFSRFNGSWALYNDTTYTGEGASLLTPTPGTTITTSSVNFQWSAGNGVNAYQLCVGYLYAGGPCNIYGSGLTTALSANVTGIPINGENLYVRLWSRIGTKWLSIDYTFIPSGTPALAALTSPTPGATLSSSSATFQWTAGGGVTGYILMLGTTKGAHDLYNSGETIGFSANVTGLPTNGLPIYARLFSQFDGNWVHYNDYVYNPYTAAMLTTPTPGATLGGNSQSFTWAPAIGATGYALWLGSTGMGSGNLYTGHTTGATLTATNLPVNGETIYARLYTTFNGVTAYNDSTFTAAAPATLTSPTAGTTLGGSSQSFTWTPVTGATGYTLWLGSTAGAGNLFDGYTTGSTLTANNLPVNGETIYARLFTTFNGVTTHTDSTFIAQ